MMKFVGRSLLSLNNWFLNQLPEGYDVLLDADAMLGAISSVEETNNKRYKLGPWAQGPGWRRPDAPSADDEIEIVLEEDDDGEHQRRVRLQSSAEWKAHYKKMASHIPRAVVKRKVEVADENGIEAGGVDVPTVTEDNEEDKESDREADQGSGGRKSFHIY